jgi:hypothetical protein
VVDFLEEGGVSMLTRPDSVKQVIANLTAVLNINETYLAGFLGVSEKSLNEWKKLGMGELTPKAYRLTRLDEVIAYLKKNHSEVPASVYKSLVENGRIVTDPTDPEDGSISLLNFIIEDPKAKVWTSSVEEVVKGFISDNLQGSEPVREANQPIRKAR